MWYPLSKRGIIPTMARKRERPIELSDVEKILAIVNLIICRLNTDSSIVNPSQVLSKVAPI